MLPPARGAAACTRVCELTASASASQVNLPSGVANVSFVGLAGSSYTGDMAIDSVVLSKTGQAHPLVDAQLGKSLAARSRRRSRV